MVKALHRAGVEVILDVVFNHTAEGDHRGPTLSFRGLDNNNRSWNCGVEGPSDNPELEKLRNRQVRNFLTMTMLSLGVPMIVMGDELRRSQCGNNNAFCQDNEISWLDWNLCSRNGDLHRFVRLLIAFRLLRDVEPERRRISLNQLLRDAKKSLAWHEAGAAGLD